LAPLSFDVVAAGGAAVISNVAKVITTTTNTVVDIANSAVSIGRWSSLAIIASSPISLLGKAAKTLLRLLRGFFWVYLRLGLSLTPSSFALVSFIVNLGENYGAAGLERDRLNGPIGMPKSRGWG
jgi:hypothetical protein